MPLPFRLPARLQPPPPDRPVLRPRGTTTATQSTWKQPKYTEK